MCTCIYIAVSVCVRFGPCFWLASAWACLIHLYSGPSGVTGRQRREHWAPCSWGLWTHSPPYWACWPLGHNLASSGFEGLPEVPSGLGSILRLGTACWSVMSLKTAQPDLSGHQGWGYILGKAGLGELSFLDLVLPLKVQRTLGQLLPTGPIPGLPLGRARLSWVSQAEPALPG